MRTPRLLLLCLAAAAIGAPAAGAAVTCTYTAGTKTLAVTASAAGDTPQIAHPLGTDGFQVRSGNPAGTIPCTNGSGLMTTVDTVTYTDTSTGGTTLTFDFAGGRFAPGATTEMFGQSEIEVTADMGTGPDYVIVRGGDQADTMRIGTPAAGEIDINQDPDGPFPDRDLHLTGVDGIQFFLNGGADVADLRGGAATGASLGMTALVDAGEGNDTVSAGDGALTAYLGAGEDTFAGGPGPDGVAPGPGDDVIAGAGGTDYVLYLFGTVPVRVDLAVAGAQDTGEGTDTITGFESAYGGPGDDAGGRLRVSASELALLSGIVERCTRTCRSVRTFTAALAAGAGRVLVPTKGLAVGRYRVRLLASDGAGNRSAERRAPFRIRR